MKSKRVLFIAKWDKEEMEIDLNRYLCDDERISFLEEMRREASKVTHREYPPILKTILYQLQPLNNRRS